MPFADHALAFDGECIAEERLRKGLAPDAVLEHARDFERVVSLLQAAVGFHRARSRRGGQRFLERLLEREGEARVLALGNREPGGLRVTAEAHDEARTALGDEIEAIAQMQ